MKMVVGKRNKIKSSIKESLLTLSILNISNNKIKISWPAMDSKSTLHDVILEVFIEFDSVRT